MSSVATCNAVAYLRRSDKSQEESFVIQKEMAQQFAEAQQIDIQQWYVDDGISGGKENRPEFQRMLADAQDGMFDTLICRNQSRFGRLPHRTSAKIMAELDAAGVRILTIEDGELDVNDLGGFIKTAVDAHSNRKYFTDLSKATLRGQSNAVGKGFNCREK